MSSGTAAGAGRGYGCGERRGRLLDARADARSCPDLLPECVPVEEVPQYFQDHLRMCRAAGRIWGDSAKAGFNPRPKHL